MVKLKALLFLSGSGEPASLNTILMVAGCTYFQAYIAMTNLEKDGVVVKTNSNFRPVYGIVYGDATYQCLLSEDFIDLYLQEAGKMNEVFSKSKSCRAYRSLFTSDLDRKAECLFSDLVNRRVQSGKLFRKKDSLSYNSKAFEVVENGLSITEVEVPAPTKDFFETSITDKPHIPNPHKTFFNSPKAKGKPGSERFIIEKRVLEKMDKDDVFWYKCFWTISSLMSHHFRREVVSVDHSDSIFNAKDKAIDPLNLQLLTYTDNLKKGSESWERMSLEDQKDYLRKAVFSNRGTLSKREEDFMEWVMSGLDLLFDEVKDE